MASATAMIIGGGVIGLSTAYHLARRRFGRVILLEKGPVGDGASTRAGGIITGLLWSETGVLARKISLALFRELSEDLPGYRFSDVGCLNLFDPPTWPERQRLLPLYDRLGAPYEILDAAEMRYRWPELTPAETDIGLFDPLGGYSEPEEYAPALAQRCRELGVEIREGVQVTGFVQHKRRVTGVTTTEGAIGGDAVICTVHTWTQHLLTQPGWPPPFKAFVHQRYLSTPLSSDTSAAIQLPAINANPYNGYIRPARGHRLLAGGETGWREEFRTPSPTFHMPALTTPLSVQERLSANLTPLVPALGRTCWESEKVGLIAFSLDGEPLLGPLPQLPGLYVGCAFHSGGFAYNPAAGLLLAEFVADGHTQIDVSAFAPDRFAPGEVADYLAATVVQDEAVRRRH
ncbi:MAG: FAD-binding oxidoreductase [Chloroflexi bacterium]|nr:FAD-binding oxidoreductase [Chloroflexota bacterium]